MFQKACALETLLCRPHASTPMCWLIPESAMAGSRVDTETAVGAPVSNTSATKDVANLLMFIDVSCGPEDHKTLPSPCSPDRRHQRRYGDLVLLRPLDRSKTRGEPGFSRGAWRGGPHDGQGFRETVVADPRSGGLLGRRRSACPTAASGPSWPCSFCFSSRSPPPSPTVG